MFKISNDRRGLCSRTIVIEVDNSKHVHIEVGVYSNTLFPSSIRVRAIGTINNKECQARVHLFVNRNDELAAHGYYRTTAVKSNSSMVIVEMPSSVPESSPLWGSECPFYNDIRQVYHAFREYIKTAKWPTEDEQKVFDRLSSLLNSA